MGRQRLETGTAGSIGTGDTIHNGGNKLRDNSDEGYHILGDFELTEANEVYIPTQGDVYPRPHAGGYYNRIPPSSTAGGSGGPNAGNLQTRVITGGKYDIDTSSQGGGANMTFTLPVIGTAAGQAKRGEKITFQNTTGSLATNPIELRPEAGQAIIGATEPNGNYVVRDNYVEITCTVIDDGAGSAGTPQWAVKIDPVFGEFGAPVDQNIYNIPINDTRRLRLFDVNSYNGCKLMLYIENRDPTLAQVTRRSMSEMLLLNNINDVYIDEYSVIRTDSSFGNLIEINPLIDDGYVVLDVTALDRNISFAIKSIETIRLTVQ